MTADLKPELIATVAEIRRRLEPFRQSGDTIGLVPTMGALHAGHGALIDAARRDAGCVVVSIFVNPIQFDRKEDYNAYSIDLQLDLEFCRAREVDIVFAPPPEEMYPARQRTFVEVTGISDHLCGRFRPGHFRGVATVVTKLFQIVRPDRAWFGEKDAQQLAVIQRLVADLNIPVEIVPVPTVREPDGLALSSRNRRLNAEERRLAPVLFRALELAANRIRQGSGSAAEAQAAALAELARHPEFRVEYVEVVDAAAMQPVAQATAPVRIAAAAWLGSVRLIDNVYVEARLT